MDEIITTLNPKFICVDVANGYMSKFIEICKEIREKYPEKILIAGNVCTSEGVLELVMEGKVGIGSGSCCTTRKKTGMSQFSSVMDCADTAHGIDAHVICDGGIQVVGILLKLMEQELILSRGGLVLQVICNVQGVN